ncbi:DUF6130 family protein [Saccharopolyspora sp. K220]|uniref:DUF6130 family protein n=1 Tax=Saccharopolyspora soli TaxID=2926618 RepID=UPI001F55CD78|nr:DUF6130 family protein [Saccharopolyspora soli]MCI2422974.1 DUF6130 family protein [Saccharopolyspora soli]
MHVAVDDAPWHWADGSGEPLIIQGLPPGPHRVWIGLADPGQHNRGSGHPPVRGGQH